MNKTLAKFSKMVLEDPGEQISLEDLKDPSISLSFIGNGIEVCKINFPISEFPIDFKFQVNQTGKDIVIKKI